MHTGRRSLLLSTVSLLGALLVGGCGASGNATTTSTTTPPKGATTSPSDSGVQGMTMVDGGCPVAQGATPCPDKPVAAKITITRSTGTDTVAQGLSDRTGHFTIPLAPGDYQVRAGSTTGATVPFGAPQSLTIHPGKFTTIVIHLDSGIR